MSNSISPNQDQNWPKSGSKSVIIYGGPLIDGRGNVFADGAVYVTRSKIAAVGDEETVFNQIHKEDNPEAFDTQGRSGVCGRDLAKLTLLLLRTI
jgi:hypothetical protein